MAPRKFVLTCAWVEERDGIQVQVMIPAEITNFRNSYMALSEAKGHEYRRQVEKRLRELGYDHAAAMRHWRAAHARGDDPHWFAQELILEKLDARDAGYRRANDKRRERVIDRNAQIRMWGNDGVSPTNIAKRLRKHGHKPVTVRQVQRILRSK